MKKFISKSVSQILMLVMILLVMMSCKSHKAVVQDDAHKVSHTAHHHTHDTVVLRDSIFIRELIRGDTVYLTRTEWRERWRTHLVHDTVVRTDSIVQVIEHPPRKYVPGFYKTCTWLFFIIIMIGVIYIILRIKS